MGSALKKVLKMVAKNVPGNGLRIALLRACGFHIGSDVYIGEDLIVTEILDDRSEKLVIGDRVAIAPRVTLITSSDPNNSRIGKPPFHPIRGRIVIEDDAWIGAGAIVMPNVVIGKRAIVGAGAVVTKDVPPDTTVVGVPAHRIRQD